MAKHIGIVACSAEGAALCYRTICRQAAATMGEHNHPEITLHTRPLAEYMVHIRSGDYQAVAEIMLRSARKVAGAGAEFAICPDNTIHQAMPFVRPASPIPWLHIAETVAEEARSRGYRRLGVTGTKYLMTGPVYPESLGRAGIECVIPHGRQRERIDRIIFTQLVYGEFPEESRLYLNAVFADLKDRGCDAAVLGCTEIPLIANPDDCPLPTLDSTRLLARAAVDYALG